MRPDLSATVDPSLFLEYYWLKEELSDFCKQYGIPATGSKEELTKKIYTFLTTGTIPQNQFPKKAPKKPTGNSPLTPDSLIPAGYRNDERHRSFSRKKSASTSNSTSRLWTG